jgi:hypothetical protein
MTAAKSEEAKSWSERAIIAALEQLHASAAESLASPTLEPNDAPLIRAALADLDAYAAPLLAVLRSIDPKAGGAFDLLRPVLFAAVIIGSRRPPPFASVEAGKRIQADYARAEKSGKDAGRRRALIDAIQAHAAAENLVLSTSEKFAESIRASVRERLKLAPDDGEWPSASTIKGAIRQIKKDKA